MRWSGLPWVLALGACVGDGPEPEVPCGPVGDTPALQIGQHLAVDGPMQAGDDVGYGTPPQGGAPYAPFEVRLQAVLGDPASRVAARGSAVEVATGEVIGSVEQTQAFFCSNTGVHEGWLYGGEIHIRFWDEPLEALEGREIDVLVEIDLPEGELVTAGGRGVLRAEL
jgi:hypothetical protein